MKDWQRPLLGDAAVQGDLVAFFRSLDASLTQHAADVLRSYPGPVSIAWSRRGRLLPRRDALRLAAAITAAQLTWIDGALSFTPPDRPGAVVEAVKGVTGRIGHKRGG